MQLGNNTAMSAFSRQQHGESATRQQHGDARCRMSYLDATEILLLPSISRFRSSPPDIGIFTRLDNQVQSGDWTVLTQ